MPIPFRQKLSNATIASRLMFTMAGCAAFSDQYQKLGEWIKTPYPQSESEPSSPQRVEEVSPPVCYIHTVRWPGESLSIISKWYTETLDQWKTIAKVNPEIDPNVVRTGMKILIPEKIVTNRNPMPQEFVEAFYIKSTKDSGKIKSPHPDEVEPALVGPKSYSGQ